MYYQLTTRVLIAIFLVAGFARLAQAQQDPQYTQFMYNKLPLNAAYTGAREVLSIRALYRDQWSGSKAGGIDAAPKTAVFSIHSPLKNEHNGLGFYFVNDRLGVEHKNQFDVTYAYRVNLGKKIKLSMGINAGILWYKANLAGSITTDGTGIDPALNQNISKVLPDVGAGLYMYHPNFYVGLSVPNFIKGELSKKEQNLTYAKKTPHFNAMVGGAIPAGKALYIRPQILYRYLANAEQRVAHTLDFNLSFLIYNRVNIGAQYRTSPGNKSSGTNLYDGDSFDAMLEVWATKQLMIGYAYDYTLSKLNNFNRGSHEIIIGYDFAFEKKKAVTPRYF
ncbi:MAG TPA: type IX secretion system membrane protein PorP/SprF [Chitinophagales bacterium]|jgi:type IX secretion system PorP/SprF family membrane protein|nr:type IX secretion system membrane protein PorP/SprF [Chitinophagales bacterium]HQO32465.1 type IX secretion system membrane protein PorP/SprF [Chitinophagales bacterium]HQO89935.1 type IX secretion system membrane protein PorP/SprF [Chitinophagales bacterium]